MALVVLGCVGSANAQVFYDDGYTYERIYRLSVAERTTTTIPLPSGLRNVARYILATGDRCTVVASSVYTPVKVQPTTLVKYLPLVDRGSAYVYSVNGDNGAPLRGIQLTMGGIGGLFVTDVCSVDLYVSYEAN